MIRLPGAGRLLGEMKRRRVFGVMLWYGAAAWLTVEVATTVAPLVGWSDRSQQIVLWTVLLGAPVAFALAWIFDITPRGVERTDDPGAAPVRRAPTVDEQSVAVLPFSSLDRSSDDDYFCDGITEDVIAALCRLRTLKVISRTSVMQYRNSSVAPPQIAQELGVAHIVTGSVRRAAGRVRIVAQLIDAVADEHLWAETFDREMQDVFAIQSDVATRIAESLQAELTTAQRTRLQRAPTEHVRAYEAYLRGRHLWNQRTERSIREGIVCLQDALREDPHFALAWAALAEAYVTLGLYGAVKPADVMPDARMAAGRALEHDAALAEGLTPLAAVNAYYDRDWAAADTAFARAIEANPRYPTAPHWHANTLAARGRFAEARDQLDRARDLDPLSAAVATNAGIISYVERDHDRAEGELRALIARDPSFPLAYMFLGLTLDAAGRTDAALAPLQDAVKLSGGSVESRTSLAYVLARSGSGDAAEALLRDAHGIDSYVSPVLRATLLVGLGRDDAALDALEDALAARAADVAWIGVRPAFDPLRTLPRFRALVEEAGLARQPVIGRAGR